MPVGVVAVRPVCGPDRRCYRRLVPLGEQFASVLSAARRGEEEALAALYRDLNPRVRRYFIAHERSDFDDLASETWLGVADGLVRFRGDEPDFRAWVFTIAHRRLLDHRRRASRRRTDPVANEDLPETATAESAEAGALERIGTEEALARIASLPPDQADVVLLGVLGGLDASDIARILDKPPGTVRVLRHRALRRLAAAMRREGVTP